MKHLVYRVESIDGKGPYSSQDGNRFFPGDEAYYHSEKYYYLDCWRRSKYDEYPKEKNHPYWYQDNFYMDSKVRRAMDVRRSRNNPFIFGFISVDQYFNYHIESFQIITITWMIKPFNIYLVPDIYLYHGDSQVLFKKSKARLIRTVNTTHWDFGEGKKEL